MSKSRHVSKQLTVDGDGTGTLEITGNYSSTADDFYFECPAGEEYEFRWLTGIIREADGITADGFGGLSALTNGLTVKLNPSTGTSQTILNAITTHSTMAAVPGFYTHLDQGSSIETIAFGVDFLAWGGELLKLDPGDQLAITANDNFTGLDNHNWRLMGRRLR